MKRVLVPRLSPPCVTTLVATVIVGASPYGALADEFGTASLRVVDESGRPVPCRVHLANAAGEPQKVAGLPFWRDHVVCRGTVDARLVSGDYRFTIERGPEFHSERGEFTVVADQTSTVTVTLKRLADLKQNGWWSGELHVHRPPGEIELHMQAEDLHVAPVITWWNNRNLWSGTPLPKEPLVNFEQNRFYHLMAGEDEREGGALMYYNLKQPLAITGSTREYPSPLKFVEQARQHEDVWIDIEKPFWWDVPVWLASGQIDSVGLANNHMCRSRMYETEAWGRPRDEQRLPAPRGNGFWTQEIYYHILNTGLRIPPSAGSASGVLPNPVGYNRVYVHTGDTLTYDTWWEGLRAGRSFVTNGPLLVCSANEQYPGSVFRIDGRVLQLALDIRLTANDAIAEVEVIKDGKVVQTVDVDRTKTEQQLRASIDFDGSGWFLVRAIADNPRTFRFASTAPFYVESAAAPVRVSRQSCRFFVDWVRERITRVKLENVEQRNEVLRHHRRALEFWQTKQASANAE